MSNSVDIFLKSKSPQKKILIKYSKFIFLITLSLLAGYNVLLGQTQDSIVYSNYYNSITHDSPLGDEIYFEYLYKISASFSRLVLRVDYEIYATVLIFISLSIKFYLFSKRPYSLYLIIAYLVIMYPMQESLALRAAVAISFVFLAFEFRSKKVVSLCLLSFGIFFHYSLMLMAPIWVFYSFLTDKKKAIKLLIFAFVSGMIFYNFFLHSSFVSQYIDKRLIGYVISNPNYFNIWSTPHVLFLSILSYLLYANIDNNDFKGKDTVLIFMFIGVLHLILAVVFFNVSMLYMRFVDVGILGFYLASTSSNFKNKSLIRLVFIVIITYEIMTKFLDVPYLVVTHILR